ncbi:MAG: hypothetical protein ACO225_12540 [Ilumatobacteraceae bacterium]
MLPSERTLRAVGLRPAEPARFRRHDAKRWGSGTVIRIEPDGSVRVSDADGAARSLRPELVQVRRPGGRGRLVWRSVSDVAVTWEQLELF